MVKYFPSSLRFFSLPEIAVIAIWQRLLVFCFICSKKLYDDGGRGDVLPADRGVGNGQRRNDYPVAHLPNALFHLLPRRRAQYAAATASPLAADGADRFQRGRLRNSAAVQPDSSARRDDLRADTHRNGRRRDRRNAGRRHRFDDHVQPALQHDDRRRRTLHPLGGRQRRLLAGRHTGQGRAAADPALRRRTGLPRLNTEGKRLGGRPQSDFVLPVARVADGHHRPHDDLHSGSSRGRRRRRDRVGCHGARDLPRAVQVRPLAGTSLRRCGRRRTVARTEEYGAGRLDGAIVSRSDLVGRSDVLYRLAEFREQLSNL